MAKYLFFTIFCLLAQDAIATAGPTDPPKFTVVLDAGHGGKKPGNSYAGVKEKDIALKVTLAIGKLLEKQQGIEVIYTRKKDVHIGLKARADVANRAKADLFVSIHLNAADAKSAHGIETFALGLTKSKDNLAMVVKENSVILLEENYEENYGGFDPKDPSSYGTNLLAQEEFLENSLEAASFIQSSMIKGTKRRSRGVKQNWFVVLLKSYMPSILVELGFLSNARERKFLTSKKGQSKLAKSIADGIIGYKNSRDFNYVEDASPTVLPEIINKDITYRIQIAASGNKLAAKSYNFKKLKDITREKEGKIYRYFTGSFNSRSAAEQHLRLAKSRGYTSAFIVSYKKGKRVRL